MQTAGRAPRTIRFPPRITPSLRIATRLSSADAAVEARAKCVSIATAGILAGSRFIGKIRPPFLPSLPPAFFRARTPAARRLPTVRGRNRSNAEIRESEAGAIAARGSRETRAPAGLPYRPKSPRLRPEVPDCSLRCVDPVARRLLVESARRKERRWPHRFPGNHDSACGSRDRL